MLVDTKTFLNKRINPTYKTELLDEFSLDMDKVLIHGRSGMKYIYEELLEKSLNMDLVDGIESYVPKRRDESLKKMFDWLTMIASPSTDEVSSSGNKGLSLLGKIEDCDVVSRRGPLSRIAAAPYSCNGQHDVGQALACTKFKGLYFLREFKTDEKTEQEANWNDYQMKATFAGFKFEQIMCSKDPNSVPNTKESVDPNPEFNGVFKSELSVQGNPEVHRILCGAELDAYSVEKDAFVELKTQYKQMAWGKAFPDKALRWYLQSYLVGTETLVIGYHQDLRLNRVEYVPVRDLLGMTRGRWRLDVCLSFLHAFIGMVKRELDNVPDGTVVVIERLPHESEFIVNKIIGEKDDEGQQEWVVITDEFKKQYWKNE